MRQKGVQKPFEAFDAWAFCREGGLLTNEQCDWPLPRLGQCDLFSGFSLVNWSISGSINRNSESLLHISGQFQADFECIVCGGADRRTVDFDRTLVLKTSEAQADEVEDDLPDTMDAIACTGSVNIRDWLEDEVMLSCPLFPKHSTCEDTPPRQWQIKETTHTQADTAADGFDDVQRPFANLGDLLKGKK